MSQVELRQNENLESALRRLKKKLDAEGTLRIYREKRYFKKPSVMKREKRKEAARKRKIEELKMERSKSRKPKFKNHSRRDENSSNVRTSRPRNREEN